MKNLIEWFRNDFIPNASDFTITQLMFLYDRYCNPEDISQGEIDFINDLMKKWGKPKLK